MVGGGLGSLIAWFAKALITAAAHTQDPRVLGSTNRSVRDDNLREGLVLLRVRGHSFFDVAIEHFVEKVGADLDLAVVPRSCDTWS